MEHVHHFNSILQSFKIGAHCVDYQQFDNYFFFDLLLQPSARVRDIQKYGDEISLALKAPGKPSIKILHSDGFVRLEFVNLNSNRLNLFEYLGKHSDKPEGEAVCLLGQTVNGKPLFMDLSKNPHMIVAGTTGSGKSILLHNIIANCLNNNDCSLYLIDPKRVEFDSYNGISNTNIGYSYADASYIIDVLLSGMEYRYDLTRRGFDISTLPYCILIIDEFADLIMQDRNNEFFSKLCLLAQKCRAARMSIIIATQRPSVDVINGTIKANFPARIACKTSSQVDSKIILDSIGAESLHGKGDALLKDNTRLMERFQIAYTNANEILNRFND